MANTKKKSNSKKSSTLKTFLIVTVVVVAAVGGFLAYNAYRDRSSNAESESTTLTVAQVSAESVPSTPTHGWTTIQPERHNGIRARVCRISDNPERGIRVMGDTNVSGPSQVVNVKMH